MAQHALGRDVHRTALVNRLRGARSQRVVAVVAPAGYGKTTLLAQWREREDRPFTDRPGAEPCVVVVDDAHLADGERLAALIAAAPDGSTVVLAGRSLPALPGRSLARLRAEGELLELGPAELALSRRETAGLLRALGAPSPEADVANLLERTEGWAAGIRHAAAEALRTRVLDGNGITRAFFRDECLAELSDEQRTFLRRSAVLDGLCPALCDAVLDTKGSADRLDALERLGLFLVPLDHRGDWLRYHHLLRDELRRELEETEPGLVAELHRRAADWFEAAGDDRSALAHALRAREYPTFLRLFGASAPDDAADWLDEMRDGRALASSPRAAALAARLHAHHGRIADAERCLAAAEKGARRDATGAARARLVRALLCADGPEQMLADASAGLAGLNREDPWHAYGLYLQGSAHGLLGSTNQAEAILSRGVHAASRTGANETQISALAQRALHAGRRGAHLEADAQLEAALEHSRRTGLGGHPATALPLVLSAQSQLRTGRWAEARATIEQAQQLLSGITVAVPWLAVQARLEVARAHVMLRDGISAAALRRQIDVIFAERRDLGCLRAERNALAREIRTIPDPGDGQTARLTGAELRLLPLLGTHLSFREIGALLFLSRHTVKTQAISAYRKLGASSRREAVLRAAALGLVDPPSDHLR